MSDFSVCDTNHSQIMITENYCLTVDHLGRRVDAHQDPDYSFECIGYFKENSLSYLFTYDDSDAFSVSIITTNVAIIKFSF